MKAVGNLIWFICGGIWMGISWYIAGLIMFITIIGIPWGKACFTIGQFSFLPFGKEAISREEVSREKDIGTGALGTIGNIIWFLLCGLWLAIGHIISSLFCFITIIGIPFGIQHLKLAGVSLSPIGKTIVTKEVAEALKKSNAEKVVSDLHNDDNT